jgi:N-sulfoglucosamine sulfohydrolase
MSELDDQIGEVLAKLKEDGLLENTIIFFWGDHGDGLPFYKREVYRRGLHIPLIVRYPNRVNAGTRNNEFISAIDLGPTMLSLANIETPTQMQGKPFLGNYKAESDREYIFGARDRIDSHYDRVRSVMDRKYQYVRNFSPEKPLYMDVKYRKSMATMRMLLEMNEAGTLNDVQSLWFKKQKSAEELYDWTVDPYQLNNLAADPKLADELKRFRTVLDNWILDTEDLGVLPETQMLSNMWQGGSEPPKTNNPIIYEANGKVKIHSMTHGASIAYRKKGESHWDVYTKPFQRTDEKYETVAMRIGYEESELIEF